MSDERRPRPVGSADVPSSWRLRLLATVPFVITALLAVALSLLLQRMVATSAEPILLVATATAPLPLSSPPSVRPTALPSVVATVTPPDRVLNLAILDLEARDRQLRSALHLLRAVAQLDDALVALQTNQLDEAERTLLLVYRSLDRAYTFSTEQGKGPLDTFRLQIGQIRDDLRIRPEGIDRRLRQLRGLMLSLVDETG